MKILFSLTYYTPYVSGLTLYVKRLAEALAKKSYQVSVISFQYRKDLKLEEEINKVRIIRIQPLFRISKGFFSLNWLLRNVREVKLSDIVVINLPQFEGIVPAILAKIFNKKLICIYHCEVVLPNGFLNKLAQTCLNWSNYLTLFFSDQVITYTGDYAGHSKILPRFSDKTRYIYPPILAPKVDKRVQKVIRGKLGSDLKRVKGLTLIGIAARLAAEKGIEYVLESIPILSSKFKVQSSKLREPGIKIVIAGPEDPVGEERYREKINHLVEKYKDYVVFIGELKEEEMGSFYSLLDVLVLPSINSTEAFGMVQVEAMLMGVPCVSSDLPGVRIPVQKTGMGIIVPIKNSQKLAEAIVEVMLNKKKYIKNREIILKEFSFEKTIRFYQKLFS